MNTSRGHILPDHPKSYISYLLRMWQASDAGQMTWRASLLDVRTGEIYRFTSLDLLVKLLNERSALWDTVKRRHAK